MIGSRFQLLNYWISETIPDLDLKDRIIINTINPHSYCVAKGDRQFRNALNSCDVLLPDGIGIVLATWWLLGKKISKISGWDIHYFLLKKANMECLRVFYLGSNEATLVSIRNRIAIDFPNCEVSFFSPPYKTEFDRHENEELLRVINSFKPDVLFVGMTAPKQEKWVFTNKELIDARIVCSVGAVFDFYAGTVKRSHPVWIKMGLEWLPRLIREPRRLAKRNFISTPLFLLDVLKAKLFNC